MALLILTGTSAFAGADTAKSNTGLFNGVTYFEMGTTPYCCNSAATVAAASGNKVSFSNGITAFGADAVVSKSVCACSIDARDRVWPKNGITLFS